MWVGSQRQASTALSPGKTWYTLYRRMGEPQDRSRRVRKISPRPARSESLYRLSYPGSQQIHTYVRTHSKCQTQQCSLPVGRGLSCGVSVACCIHDTAVSFTEASGSGQSYVLEATYRPGLVPCVLVGRR